MTLNLISPFVMIPENWNLVRLQDITTKIGSGATPRGGKEVYLPERENFALVRSQNVFDRHFDPSTLAYISDDHANELRNVWLEPGDVLLNITGDGITFSRATIVPEQILPACVNQHVSIIRTDPNKCLPGYLVSYLTHPEIKHYIESFNAGGSRRAITKGHIESFVVPLPPLEEQHAIAHVLGSLDDKIEANRQINETLEAIARAIFKSWFVDFDPVHAKANGESPVGMDAETAALFPDHFEDSELGPIPAGWQVAVIGDHVRATKGLSYKGGYLADSPEDGLPMHNLNSVNEWGTYKFDGIKFYSGEYQARHVVRPGDLIVANTEQGFDLLLIASPAIVPAMFGEKGIFSHHIHKIEIKPKSPVTRLFLYYRMMMPPFRDVLQGYTNGTTVNMLPNDAFERPKFVMPSAGLMQRFDDIVAPMLEEIEANYEESRTLAKTRDALLPKLVSGKIRVGELRK